MERPWRVTHQLSHCGARADYAPKLIGNAAALFGWYDYQLFWSTALIIHRVQNDQSSDTITLPKPKRAMIQHMRPEYRDALRARFRMAKLTDAERGALEKIGRHRDLQIAHNVDQANLEEAEKAIGLSFTELQTALGALSKQYDACRIGAGAGFELDSTVQEVGRVLDTLVLNGWWSKTYERDPIAWNETFASMISAQEFHALNKNRQRHNLPAIPDTLWTH